MRGRKPNSDNVVPLTADSRVADFDAYAKTKAAELKPEKLPARVSKVWDRVAPRVCHPTVDRLKAHNVEGFKLLCDSIARYEQLVAWLSRHHETYVTETRNGTQHKSRPEVAQRNEAFRQALTLLRDFGLTPAAERGMANGQAAFDFGENDFD